MVDETYARSTAFGGQVVPGSMIAALAIGLGSLDVPIPATAGMVGMTWRFLKPVRPGDSLHTTWRLNRKRAVENPQVGLVFWQIDVFNQRGEVVASGEVGRLVQRHTAESGGGGGGRVGRVGAGVAAAAEVAADGPGAEGEAASEPASRRRRRRGGRGGGGGGGAGGAEREARTAIAELPEPAPADTPSPSRRRRRRRGSNGTGGGRAAQAPSATEVTPPPPPVEVPPGGTADSGVTGDAGRGLRGVFRRLRGGGAGT